MKVLQGHAERTLADYRHLSDKLDEGWRLSCQAEVNEDTACEVPRLMRTPKAATMGVGRFVLLEPNVQKLLLELEEPSLEDARSHLRRRARRPRRRGPRGLARPRDPAAARASCSRRASTTLTATVVGDHLVDVEPGDTRERMFGVSLDIGTTTVVATLVDLRSGARRRRGLDDQPAGARTAPT